VGGVKCISKTRENSAREAAAVSILSLALRLLCSDGLQRGTIVLRKRFPLDPVESKPRHCRVKKRWRGREEEKGEKGGGGGGRGLYM
jgi:hypothetical protein